MFHKYLGPLRLHINSFVFKIMYGSQFSGEKKLFENPILSCRDIKQKQNLILFGKLEFDAIKYTYSKESPFKYHISVLGGRSCIFCLFRGVGGYKI